MEHGAKLYTKSTCMACINKVYSCPYCNGEGKVYVEASDKSVSRWLAGLTEERKQSILEDGSAAENDPGA